MFTKSQLQNILSDTESYHTERTTSSSNIDKICQAICAFSNDISGSGKRGYLIIGAKDNGELSGLKVDDRLLLQIANIRTDGNILPQPVMTVDKFTFDAMPCLGTTIDDLDIKIFKKEYLSKAVADDVLVEDKRSIEEQLTTLGFYDLRYNCPTNGAIILFGKNPERYLPGSYIQYVHFKEGFGADINPKKPDKSQIKAVKIEDEILDIIKITPDISIPKLAIELDRTPDSIRYYLR